MQINQLGQLGSFGSKTFLGKAGIGIALMGLIGVLAQIFNIKLFGGILLISEFSLDISLILEFCCILQGLSLWLWDYLHQEFPDRLQPDLRQTAQFTQATLEQREAELSALFDAMSDLVIVFDAHGQYLKIPPANPHLLYRPIAEVLGKTLHDVLPPDLANLFLSKIQQSLETKQTVNLEYDMDIDGQEMWFSANISPLTEKSVVWVIRDISERKRSEAVYKQAEAALRESEVRFRTIFEHAAVGIAQASLSGNFLRVNRRLCQILGYTEAELLERSFQDITHPDDRQISVEKARQILANEIKAYSLEKRYIRKDGQICWVNLTVSLVRDAAGIPQYCLSVIEDICDRKQAEQALQENQQFIQSIAESSPNFLHIYDIVERRKVYENRSFLRIMGYSPDQIKSLDNTFLALIHPDDLQSVEQYLEKLKQLQEGEVIELEFRVKNAGGQWHWLCSRDTAFKRNPDGTVRQVSGTLRDITDRKQVEEQLKATICEKEALLREIHHRVKNNLYVVSNLLDLQSETIEDEHLLNLFADSQSRIQAMALIHEQLYQSEDLVKVDISEYIHRLINNLFFCYGDSIGQVYLSIMIESIYLDLETAIPCGLIINELVTNAFKHAFPDRRSGEIRIKLYADQNQQLHLVVQDTGIGIPQEFDWDSASSLGLKLVRILAKQLKATVNFSDSHEGNNHGTSVHLSFTELKYKPRF